MSQVLTQQQKEKLIKCLEEKVFHYDSGTLFVARFFIECIDRAEQDCFERLTEGIDFTQLNTDDSYNHAVQILLNNIEKMFPNEDE